MVDSAFSVEETVQTHLAGWLRDLGGVRRLAAKTIEAYGRDRGRSRP